jgi:spore coat protein U-like protein
MTRVSVFRLLAAAFAVVFGATAANAGTATGNLNIQANVADACTVSDATLAFGVVNPTNGTVLPSSTPINVTCTLGTPFSVGLNDGQNANASQRRLRRGATTDYLNYELYKDLLMLGRFGDTVGERATGLLGLGVLPTVVTVYGAVPSGQTAASGSYADVVQITVYY